MRPGFVASSFCSRINCDEDNDDDVLLDVVEEVICSKAGNKSGAESIGTNILNSQDIV